MARRRRRNKDAILDGLIGAGIGYMDFKLSEQAAARLEQAEIAKEQRLAAIRAGETEAANQFQLARDAAQGEQRLAEIGATAEGQKELANINRASAERVAGIQATTSREVAGISAGASKYSADRSFEAAKLRGESERYRLGSDKGGVNLMGGKPGAAGAGSAKKATDMSQWRITPIQ